MADHEDSSVLPGPFLNHVKIRNYKSIGACSINLKTVTVLVGRNGAGKSNFLDALRFVSDGLQTSLGHAIRDRGGIEEVRRRSTGHPRNFAVELDFLLPGGNCRYGFEIAARKGGVFAVKQEHLFRVFNRKVIAEYRVLGGKVVRPVNKNMPPVSDDRLYLVNASGLPEFRPIYDALCSMGFYNLNPEAMKELQSPDAGELLYRDGSNIASVIARITDSHPDVKERLKAYLSTIVPGIIDVERVALGPKETLRFRQEVVGSKHPWRFLAVNMSDGTLRALGTLVAVMQLANSFHQVKLIGIEEPETALHPAATSALVDALREAGSHTQTLLTSHSPDLLEQIEPATDGLLAVQSRRGTTEIGPVDKASLDAMKEMLYSPGELLRMDQLEPDRKDIARQKRLPLFEEGACQDFESHPS